MSELDYRQATKRVRRSMRTIKLWRRAGLEMGAAIGGRRVVEVDRQGGAIITVTRSGGGGSGGGR